MTLRCPVCRADNTERACRRCRADLGLLWDLEADRARALVEARQAWQRGDAPGTLAAAQAAAGLRAGPDAARWTALAHLAAGNFAAALAAWRQAQAQPAQVP